VDERELERRLGYVPCEDGLFCTVNDRCESTICTAGVPRDCSALDDVCAVGACNEDEKRCVKVPRPNPGPCDDGNACTVDDRCVGTECRGTPAPERTACDDNEPCTSFDGTPAQPDLCDAVGRCRGEPVRCPDDGLFCDGQERCCRGRCVSTGNP